MRILIAPNAFKGSLSASAAADAIERGLARGLCEAELSKLPVADGGDGTAEVIAEGAGGTLIEASALDPLGRPVLATFAVLPNDIAVVDVASASGLSLVEAGRRDPRAASSFGTGQLILAALDQGVSSVVLGIGGSATVDGGAGILQAFGAKLKNASGKPLAGGGAALRELSSIDLGALDPRVRSIKLSVACDVESPLLGERGAASMFGPQKGADPRTVVELEAGLSRWAEVLEATFNRDVRTLRHGGAAGGIAAGLSAALGADLVSGIDWVLEVLHFDQHLDGVDLVITGEGRLDRQTLEHKAPLGVARAARQRGVAVVAIAGGIEEGFDQGVFDAVFSSCPGPISSDAAIEHAATLLENTAEQIARLLSLGTRIKPASR